MNIEWEMKTEVVVLGYGGAGAVSAIAAHDCGAEVAVFEKQSENKHYSNTQMSGAVFVSIKDKKGAASYFKSLYNVDKDVDWTGSTVIDAFLEYAADNNNWIQGLGGKTMPFSTGGEHKQIPGWESIVVYKYRGWGWGFMKFLKEQVAVRGIPVRYDMQAVKLLRNAHGIIEGVRFKTHDISGKPRYVNIQASRAVILCTGGFEFDDEMKLNYLRIYPTFFWGTPSNTGDGIRMAQDVGAKLWHMNVCSARLVAKFSDFPIAFTMDFGSANWAVRLAQGEIRNEPCGFIIVDREGKRFTNETYKQHTLYYELTLYDSHALQYPRVPCFWIFDQKRIEAGPLPIIMAGPSGPVRLYEWSKDNSVEINKGWIIKGNTIDHLCSQLSIDSDNLSWTIENYNSYCKNGHDPEYGRQPSQLIPLSKQPLYAVRLWPGGSNTQGGPKRNHKAQVLDVYDEPIPRLYSSGELGSIYGMLYPSGGGNIAECIAFGRIAGENAAREMPI